MKLNCTMKELISAAFKAILLRHGCSTCEADSLVIEPGPINGGHISLASVRSADGRELYRVYDLDDLDDLMADPSTCYFLAKALRRLGKIPTQSART